MSANPEAEDAVAAAKSALQRELPPERAAAYFDALSIIYHTGTEEGKETYGDKFRGSGAFLMRCAGRFSSPFSSFSSTRSASTARSS